MAQVLECVTFVSLSHLELPTFAKENIAKCPMGLLRVFLHRLEAAPLHHKLELFLSQRNSKECSYVFHTQGTILERGM